ncbi:Sterol uptake control protein 2 [Yarrowia sp. C11]|nr:Sterol uptake control protein 2 [Yarrowia sp. E02]KAG5372685.1 Sterol uptake control protein 2 [Yarrowia sp. C11]
MGDTTDTPTSGMSADSSTARSKRGAPNESSGPVVTVNDGNEKSETVVKTEDRDSVEGDNGPKRRKTSLTGSETDEKKDAKATKRKPHSKSRRGCATCKKRRVKCDEKHPVCRNCEHLGLECSYKRPLPSYAQGSGNTTPTFAPINPHTVLPAPASTGDGVRGAPNMVDLKLLHNYMTVAWKTITAAGISNEEIWGVDVPALAFQFPFLMHSILVFSASHLSCTQQQNMYTRDIAYHRGEALGQLREAVRHVTPENTDALVAGCILLGMDGLANAAPIVQASEDASTLPPTAWIHHVRGAASILSTVWPLPPHSRFYRLIGQELIDLGSHIMNTRTAHKFVHGGLKCFDDDLADLYPVDPSSVYFPTLAFIDLLFHQRYRADFILRVFAFPALLDNQIIALLFQGDEMARRIIRVYYKLMKSYTSEMKETVWFLEGVSRILPADMEALGPVGLSWIGVDPESARMMLENLQRKKEAMEANSAGSSTAASPQMGNAGAPQTPGSPSKLEGMASMANLLGAGAAGGVSSLANLAEMANMNLPAEISSFLSNPRMSGGGAGGDIASLLSNPRNLHLFNEGQQGQIQQMHELLGNLQGLQNIPGLQNLNLQNLASSMPQIQSLMSLIPGGIGGLAGLMGGLGGGPQSPADGQQQSQSSQQQQSQQQSGPSSANPSHSPSPNSGLQ